MWANPSHEKVKVFWTNFHEGWEREKRLNSFCLSLLELNLLMCLIWTFVLYWLSMEGERNNFKYKYKIAWVEEGIKIFWSPVYLLQMIVCQESYNINHRSKVSGVSANYLSLCENLCQPLIRFVRIKINN